MDSAPGSFAAGPGGVTVRFNRPLDPTTLTLYDTQAGGLGPADVTLVGADSGPIAGSLLLDPDGTSFTFLPTGGLLAPGTYTVTLRSAVDGIRDTAGGLLDGDEDGTPGGHYIATFTVAATAVRVVSIPDFARGPGQPVDLPANGAGLPIRLDDGAGVTSARLVLAYDPRLLVITAAAVGSGLPNGSAVALDLSAPGLAVLTVTSPSPLAAGPVDLVRLTANVPANAPYAAAQALRAARGGAQRRGDRGDGRRRGAPGGLLRRRQRQRGVQRDRRVAHLAARGGAGRRPGGLPAGRPGDPGRHQRQRDR